ncbi:MAG: AAA family ATPase [Deltaproteobacteria bacterium]|nr:AAA family ATPase [Deltaproteobacteria bacterium]
MLTSLKVKGLWSIQEAEIQFGALNVLLGANGAGKSSLLNVFRLLRAIMSRGLSHYVGIEMGGASSVLRYGPKKTPGASLELEFRSAFGRNGYTAMLSYAAGDRLLFAEERVWFERDGQPRGEHVIGPGGHAESQMGETLAEGHPAGRTARFAKYELDRYCHHHFHDTSMTAALRSSGSVSDTPFLHADGSNLAAFLLSMRTRDPIAYERIRGVVRLAFRQFDDFVLEPSGGSNSSVQLRWRERGNGYDFGPHQLSDGTLRFIALATLLLQPGSVNDGDYPNFPKLIVLDEPELGLHPVAMQLVAEMLRTFSAQVIVATQSVDMLGQLVADASELDRLLLVDRDANGTVFRRADRDALGPWLEDYAPTQLWTHGLIGALP